MRRRFSGFVGAAVLLTACQSPLTPPRPAVLVESSPAVKEQIQAAVSQALGNEVLLSDAVFVETSQLIVEPKLHRHLDATGEVGRRYGKPAHFQLLVIGGRCVLEHSESGDRWSLENVRCREEAGRDQ